MNKQETVEPFEQRLIRIVNDDFRATAAWLLSSIKTYFLPEIRAASENDLWSLFFLGSHALMQTVGQTVFGKGGLDATRFYLEKFVDGDPTDRRYSTHAELLHNTRNIEAHQWFGRQMHEHRLDFVQSEGCRLVDGMIHLNPKEYAGDFLSGFGRGGRIGMYEDLVEDDDLVLRKYEYVRRFIGVKGDHPISQRIRSLLQTQPGDTRCRLEEEVYCMIIDEYFT